MQKVVGPENLPPAREGITRVACQPPCLAARTRDSFTCDQVRRVAKRDLFPIAGDAICAVAADSGTPTAALTQTDGGRSLKFPWFLPDGRRFLFLST
jgi:hypothetical protein